MIGLYVKGNNAGTLCTIVDQDNDITLVCPLIDYSKQGSTRNYYGKYTKVPSITVIGFAAQYDAERAWKIIQKAESVQEGLRLWNKVRCLA
jgi:hypothetical protein